MIRDLSIQKKQLFITLICSFFPFVIVMLCIFQYTIRVQDERYLDLTGSVSSSIANAINVRLGDMVDTSFFLIGDDNVRAFMQSEDLDINSHTYTGIFQKALMTLYHFHYNEESYQYIILESVDGRHMLRGISSYNPFSAISEEEKRQADLKTGGWFWTETDSQLAICRQIRDMYDLSHCLGYVKIGLTKKQFEKLFSDSLKSDCFALISEDRPIINTMPYPMEQMLESNHLSLETLLEKEGVPFPVQLEKNKYLLTVVRLNDRQTLFLNLSEDRRDNTNTIILFVAATVIASFLIVILQTSYVRRWIIKPILKLAGMMGTIENEERFNVRFRIQGKDEISTLANRFNQMADKLDVLYNEAHRNQMLIREAELQSLQAEMQPHFLSNAINAIYWTLQAKQYDRASSMLTDLSNMFQYTLTKTPSGMVTLDQVIRHAEAYLRLQKSRLMDSFSYSVDIDADRKNLIVMKYILQPLIENAFAHGLTSIARDGYLSISVYESENILFYEVYDNGVSADAERIQTLLDPNNESIGEEGHGIALHNINKRLKLKFGPAYGISFKQPSDGGIVFIVRQPVIRAGESLPEGGDENA